MSYKTIFKAKPKKENKREFCIRIVKWLNTIDYYCDGYSEKNGKRMINDMFKYSKFNNGYSDIDDLLNEVNKSYKSIFELCIVGNNNIGNNELLANIDIISNCLISFIKTDTKYFYNEEEAIEAIEAIMKAINEFLLCNGYKLKYDEQYQQFFIIDNNIIIDTDAIDDNKIKSEIISYYDYRNTNDIDEKKKILVNLIGKLENKKNDINNLMGAKVADIISNYANNFNLRHNNIDNKYKKYYNNKIANLSENDMLKWWDYIFAFIINIYMNLEKLENVNINNGYK